MLNKFRLTGKQTAIAAVIWAVATWAFYFATRYYEDNGRERHAHQLARQYVNDHHCFPTKRVPAGMGYDYFEGSEVHRAARTQYVCEGLVNTVNIPDDPAAD